LTLKRLMQLLNAIVLALLQMMCSAAAALGSKRTTPPRERRTRNLHEHALLLRWWPLVCFSAARSCCIFLLLLLLLLLFLLLFKQRTAQRCQLWAGAHKVQRHMLGKCATSIIRRTAAAAVRVVPRGSVIAFYWQLPAGIQDSRRAVRCIALICSCSAVGCCRCLLLQLLDILLQGSTARSNGTTAYGAVQLQAATCCCCCFCVHVSSTCSSGAAAAI
jgi:hypothetical protein